MTPTLPRPGSVSAPKYWMHETSGRLHAAVRAYLHEPQTLSFGHVAILRLYIKQWIDSPAWDAGQSDEGRRTLATLRRRAERIASANDIRAWLLVAEEFGVDPL